MHHGTDWFRSLTLTEKIETDPRWIEHAELIVAVFGLWSRFVKFRPAADAGCDIGVDGGGGNMIMLSERKFAFSSDVDWTCW